MDHNILSILKTDFQYTPSSQSHNTVYLHIKFNLPLDASCINESTVFIAKPSGHYLPCHVRSDKEGYALVIAISSYDEGVTYRLSITQEVHSIHKNRLRDAVVYTFTILNGKPCNFAQYRTSSFFNAPLADVAVIQKKSLPAVIGDDKLAARVNFAGIFYGIGFLIFLIIAQLTDSASCYLFAGLFLLAALIDTLKNQLTNSGKSITYYNKGVRSFRAKRYQLAISYFEKSFELDRSNHRSKKALHIAFDKYVNNIK